MSTIADTASGSAGIAEIIASNTRDFTHEQVDRVIAECRRFLGLYRAHCVLRDPAKDVRAAFESGIRFWQLTLRAMQITMSEYPDRQRAKAIDALVWNFDEARSSLRSAMTDAEAEALMCEAFPDEQRA